jgi:hypothetical protein
VTELIHNHPLDGHRHDECPMCDEIRSRDPAAKRLADVERLARRYGKIADRDHPDE